MPHVTRFTKTYIWNIEDLENPVLVNTYVGPETSIDHNQYIVGDLVRLALFIIVIYATLQ